MQVFEGVVLAEHRTIAALGGSVRRVPQLAMHSLHLAAVCRPWQSASLRAWHPFWTPRHRAETQLLCLSRTTVSTRCCDSGDVFSARLPFWSPR